MAGLLLFRVLYYIVPFVFALAILGVRELVYVRRHTVLPHPRTVEVTEPLVSEIERKKSE